MTIAYPHRLVARIAAARLDLADRENEAAIVRRMSWPELVILAQQETHR